MTKTIRHIFCILILAAVFTGCREEDFQSDDYAIGPDGEVMFYIDIDGLDGTRGAVDESKKNFTVGELLHVKAEYQIKGQNNETTTMREYGVIRYAGNGSWVAHTENLALRWPGNCTGGSFELYYINGSDGALSANEMPPTLLSDYKLDQIPMMGEVANARYGQAIRVQMKRLFSLLTLTDLKEGVSDELWFTLPSENDVDPEMYVELNNAFSLKFNPDPETMSITRVFSQEASADYKDNDGNPLVYVKSRLYQTETADGTIAEQTFLLEPKVYRKFSLLYPRSRNTYSTYLNYTRDLKTETGDEGFVANGRYKFSVLKSLGVIVEEEPEEGWDKSDPFFILDVESFLRAMNAGSDYFEEDLNNPGEYVQILEKTEEGTRLLRNIDFNYAEYDVFENGLYRPVLSGTFDGNYHYISHLGCPLLYTNNGVIINLGLKDCETKNPIVSTENLERYGSRYDNSHNGFIAGTNNGTVTNVRVSNARMNINILTSDPDEPAQEAHDASLLFGVNRGNVYDIWLAGYLELTVDKDSRSEYVPSVTIGAVAGQNSQTIYGIESIEEDGFETPEIMIYNNCKGENGVYRIGGLVGNNMGNLYNAFINRLTVDASLSMGLESYIGGLVGESPYSSSGAPTISGCIVRGEVIAGTINTLVNMNSYSYAGGVAGQINIQTNVLNNSVSVGVTGSPFTTDYVEYAEGGAFGSIITTTGAVEGTIRTLACYGSQLMGQAPIGNFAGRTPAGFDWSHYAGNDINIRKLVEENIGQVGAARSIKARVKKGRR